MALIAILMNSNLTSCSMYDPAENSEPQRLTIPLTCVGEILDVTHENLTRSGENSSSGDYEIYVYTSNGLTYASGSFDIINNITIELLDNETYRFEVIYYPDRSWGAANKFTYNVSTPNPNDDYILPGCYCDDDIYYGTLSGYSPNIDEGVEIYLKRMTFGLKLVAENLADGASIKTRLQRRLMTMEDTATPAPDVLTNSSPECEKIYSFHKAMWKTVYNGTLKDDQYVNYNETADLQIILTRVDGIEVDLGTYAINIERNKKTCVNINVGDSDSIITNRISITLEDENITDGKQYKVDTSEGTITESPTSQN